MSGTRSSYSDYPTGLGAGGVENFVRSWFQDSFTNRTIAGAAASVQAFGLLGPEREEGYSPFTDPALNDYLAENPGSMRMFLDARSPAHAQHIRGRTELLREREEALTLGGAFISRMLAGVASPESIATLPLGIGGLTAATRAGRALEAAGKTAALAAGQTAAELGLGRASLPEDIAPDILPEVALAAVLGGALGGAAGAISPRTVRRAAAQHAAQHDLADGLRTPGVDYDTTVREALDDPPAVPPVRLDAETLAWMAKHGVPPDEADIGVFLARMERVEAEELPSDPNDWSPALKQAYAQGDWLKFSMLRGYSPEAISNFNQYMRLADSLTERYGEEFTAGLQIPPNRSDPALPEEPPGFMAREGEEPPPLGGRSAASVGEGRAADTTVGTLADPEVESRIAALWARIAPAYTQLEIGEGLLDVGVQGMALGNVVRLARELDEGTATYVTRHEAIHTIFNSGVLSKAEVQMLVDSAIREDWISKWEVDRRWGKLSEMERIEEAIAEEFAAWKKNPEAVRGPIAAFFQRMWKVLTDFLDGIRGDAGLNAGRIFDRIDRGEMGGRTPTAEVFTPDGRFVPLLSAQLTREVQEKLDTLRIRAMFDSQDPEAFEPGRYPEEDALDDREDFMDDGPRDPRDPFGTGRVPEDGSDDIYFRPLSSQRSASGAAPPTPPPSGPTPDPERIAPGSGAGWITWTELPWFHLKNNKFVGEVGRMVARIASELMQDPGLRMNGTSNTNSVEARAGDYSYRYVQAVEATDAAYFKYAGYDPEAATAVRARLEQARQSLPTVAGRELGAPPEGKLSMADFESQVYRATVEGKHAIPEVMQAARVWREFYDRFEKELAESGVVLSGNYRGASMAAVQREIDAREPSIKRLQAMVDTLLERTEANTQAIKDEAPATQAAHEARAAAKARVFLLEERLGKTTDETERGILEQQIEAGKAAIATAEAAYDAARPAQLAQRDRERRARTQPLVERYERLLGEQRARQESAAQRLEEASKAKPHPEAYVPHNWLQAKVIEGRDALVKILGDYWDAERMDGSWAPGHVRGEIAISHILRDSIGTTLEKALARNFILGAMEPGMARAKAAELAAATHAHLAATEPGRLDVEIKSAFGRRISRTETPGLYELVKDALMEGGISGKLDVQIEEVLGVNRDATAPLDFADRQRPGHAKQREIDLPTHMLIDYLDTSLKHIGADYARRMGTAIEMADKMGDPSMLGRLGSMEETLLGEVAAGRATLEDVDKALQATRDSRDKLLGSFRIPEDPSAMSVRVLRTMTHMAIMSQLGQAIYSSLTDIGREITAHGLTNVLRGAMEMALTNRADWKLAGDEGRKAGAALELATMARQRELNELREMNADAAMGEKVIAQGAAAMQFVNLVGPWTQMMQRFSAALSQSEMVELSVKSRAGTLTPAELKRLNAYGLDEAQAQRVAGLWEAAGAQRGGILYLANTDAWMRLDPDAARGFRAALKTAVDSAIMRPGAADRPNFMSAPLWQTTLLYKGFAMTATSRLLMSGMQQRDMRVLSGMMASVSIAWLIGGPSEGPYDEHPIASSGRMFQAIERSGVLGILGDVNNAIEHSSANDFGLRPLLGIDPPTFAKDPSWAQRAGAIAGPAVSPLLRGIWAVTAEEATGDLRAGAVRRMIPFNNLLWVDGGFRALQREAGTLIGD